MGARSPAQRAKAELELTAGTSIGEVARKYGIPRPTVQTWYKALKKGEQKTDFEIKRDAFIEAYAAFGVATMEMLTAQARLLKDPDYLSKKSTDDVLKHTQFIRDTFARFEARHSPVVGRDALPERSEPECEIVDAEPV